MEDVVTNKVLPSKSIVMRIARTVLVFSFCNVAWIFFRSESVGQAIFFMRHMFDGLTRPMEYIALAQQSLYIDIFIFLKIVFMLVLVTVFDFYNKDIDVIECISSQKTLLRWSVYVILVFVTFLLLPVTPGNEFVYFKF